MRVTSITQLKIGQKVKAIRDWNKVTHRKPLVGMSKKDKKNWIKENTHKGIIKSIDYGRGIFIIEQSNGQQKIVDILKFIIDILPLVDAIIFWVGQKFNRLFKKNKVRGL